MKFLRVLVLASALPLPVFAADSFDFRPAYTEQTNYYASSPWARPYVGVFGGVATASHHYGIEIPGASVGADISGGGLLGGIRAGYDYAFGDVLVGASVEGGISNIHAAISGDLDLGGNSLSGNIESKLTAFLNTKLRLGIIQNNNMFYVHGGPSFGWVDILEDGEKIPGVIENARIGYTVGAGYERAIGESATFQTEYSYTNLGQSDIYAIPGGPTLHEDVAFHTITAGVNLRF